MTVALLLGLTAAIASYPAFHDYASLGRLAPLACYSISLIHCVLVDLVHQKIERYVLVKALLWGG